VPTAGGGEYNGMRISDLAAVWIGRVTLGTVLAAITLALLAMLVSSDVRWVESNNGLVLGILFGLAIVAWSVAHFAMVWHQDRAGHVSGEDVAEWEAREDSKLGGLVPFVYLLGTKQRRIVRYLGGTLPKRRR
jgi:hypothetical protein